MDRDAMIEGKREALGRYVLMIFAILGVAPGGMVTVMPRRAYYAALALLRPLESALRRLIVVVAQGMAVPEVRTHGGLARQQDVKGGDRSARFALFDSRKDFGAQGRAYALHPPRVTVMGVDAQRGLLPDASSGGDAPVDAGALGRRVLALDAAWSDLPGQARRLLRLQARRAAMRAAGQPVRCIDPLRPGWPPGHRCRGQGPVHELLVECDGMARFALAGGGA